MTASGSRGISRRSLLTGGVTASVGAVVGAGAAAALSGTAQVPADTVEGAADTVDGAAATAVAFHGDHQAGVDRPGNAQSWARFIALDLLPGADRDAVGRLMRVWTGDGARLMSGEGPLADLAPELTAATSRLTVTVGVGPGLLRAVGAADLAPDWLAPLPAFDTDALEDRWSGGDLLLLVAADDPTAVSHASRTLVGAASAVAAVRWVQPGFLQAPTAGEGRRVPRNLFGMVDGMVNPLTAADHDRLVWIRQGAGPDWLAGGTGLVLRRIRMDLGGWDALGRPERDAVLGRRMSDGSPLSAPRGAAADTAADLAVVNDNGFPVIGTFSHVRRARGEASGPQFLRRGWNYDDGGADVGLLFAAWSADPAATFVPVQRRLAEADLLNQWTTHVGSAVFAILPGCAAGEALGAALLA